MEGKVCPRGASMYAWRNGDTLQMIALQNGVTEQAVRLANEGMNFDAIAPGDAVCIPPRQLACVSGELYTVRSGDTFYSIANAFDISTLELSERNPYVDPNDLVVGQVLCVPRAQIGTEEAYCPEDYISGTVGYGQAVTDILLRYNISYQAFRLANPSLTPNRLLPGQRFCIPPSAVRGLCAAGGQRYVIEDGETLSSVAERFGVTRGRLLLLNPSLAPGDFVGGRVICVG